MERPTRIRMLITALLLVLSLTVTGCSAFVLSAPDPAMPTPVPKPTQPPTATTLPVEEPAHQVSYVLDPAVSQGSNAFGLDLLRLLADEGKPANMMISPVSVMMALGMTANGAVGPTQTEMLDALRLQGLSMQQANQGLAGLLQAYSDPALPATLAIANALWLAEGTPFHQDYLDDTARHYDAEIATLRMGDGGGERINQWVSDKTQGEIDEIVTPPLGADVVMVLTNAIYFKGKWRTPFDPEMTRPRTFFLLDGTEAEAPTMSQTGDFGLWANESDGDVGDAAYRVLALPYGETGNLQMWIFLPDARDGLSDVLASLTAEDLLRINQGLTMQEVYVAIPQFESDYAVTLNDALIAMGMPLAFAGGDFSAMSPNGGRFYIDEVKHKSAITVDEEGTVAAAATSVTIKESAMVERATFVADHPFVYGIWDGDAETLLFVGMLVEP